MCCTSQLQLPCLRLQARDPPKKEAGAIHHLLFSFRTGPSQQYATATNLILSLLHQVISLLRKKQKHNSHLNVVNPRNMKESVLNPSDVRTLPAAVRVKKNMRYAIRFGYYISLAQSSASCSYEDDSPYKCIYIYYIILYCIILYYIISYHIILYYIILYYIYMYIP